LGALVVGRNAQGSLSEQLSEDPGLEVLRELVEAQRAGAAVETLRLTTRLIRLTLGSDALHSELRTFWSTLPPALFAGEEGEALGTFLAGRHLSVPHLDEVLGFERALLRIYRGGPGEIVRFGCHPEPLLTALMERRLPGELPSLAFDVHLSNQGQVEAIVQ